MRSPRGFLAALFFLLAIPIAVLGQRFFGIGQRLEKWLGDLLIFWFVAMLLIDSQGKTRILGFVAMSIVVCVELYSYSLSYLGASLNAAAPGLKVLYLLPFVWFLFESKKKISLEVARGL